jgi:hypothetical protein
MAHDMAVERWLTENKYAFRFEKAALLTRINVVEADLNPARLHRKFDDDLAYRYAQHYEKGDDFPAIVVQEVVGQKLWLMWGGRHRYAAAGAAGKTHHDMIVVFGETSGARIDRARRVMNSLGVGKADGTAEKLQHISELRKQFPRDFTLDQLADDFAVKRATITRYLAVVASEERAERLSRAGFWSSPKVSQELKAEAQRLQSDEVFCAVVDLVHNHHTDMRGGAGPDFVRKLRAVQNDKTRLAMIIDRDKELLANDEDRKPGRRKVPTSKATRYTGHVNALVRDFPGSAEKLHLGDLGSCATYRRLRKVTVQAQDNLIELVAEWDRLIAEAEKVEAWRAARRGASDSATTSPPP